MLFKCLECPKICNNAGSLKRHVNAKHKNITISAEANILTESNGVDGTEIANDQVVNDNGKTCNICNKSLKNETTLKRHLATVHKNVDQQNQTKNMIGVVGKNGGLSNSRIRSILSSTEVSQTNSIEDSSTESYQDDNFKCSVCQKTLNPLLRLLILKVQWTAPRWK